MKTLSSHGRWSRSLLSPLHLLKDKVRQLQTLHWGSGLVTSCQWDELWLRVWSVTTCLLSWRKSLALFYAVVPWMWAWAVWWLYSCRLSFLWTSFLSSSKMKGMWKAPEDERPGQQGRQRRKQKRQFWKKFKKNGGDDNVPSQRNQNEANGPENSTCEKEHEKQPVSEAQLCMKDVDPLSLLANSDVGKMKNLNFT